MIKERYIGVFMEKWILLNKRADFQGIGREFGVDQVIARIIRNKDIIETEDIRKYLYCGINDLHDPHSLKDGDKLVEILVKKIENKASIRIIGDYDVDGVMSSHILKTALSNCGACVSIQIPDRIHDGYGLNKNLIEKALADQVDTILTCDNGISAIDEIAFAKEKGMTVLVTDHHEIPFDEKDGIKQYKSSIADAIVNPHQADCSYPYKFLCGAGVAFKIVCLLYEKMGKNKEEAYKLLEYVAFATVCDIMPLTGENRNLVKLGLTGIHHTNNIGIQALIGQCGLEQEDIAAYHFGHVLGPCINATGRLDTAKRALELLSAEDAAKAIEIASELVEINHERKELTLQGVEQAIALCESTDLKEDMVLVLYLPEVHESIAGIIAGRVRERYHKPTFILTKGENGVKGSGRSIEAYSMYEEMCKCSELFTKFGGHPMAAGLSLEEENVEIFREKINSCCSLTKEDLIETVRIDVPMPMGYVDRNLVEQFRLLEPFGKDNTKPVFAEKNVKLCSMRLLGANKNVIKFSLLSQQNQRVTAIYFGDTNGFCEYVEMKFGKEQVEKAFMGKENNIVLSFVYYPKINKFRGVEELQFEIQYYQ